MRDFTPSGLTFSVLKPFDNLMQTFKCIYETRTVNYSPLSCFLKPFKFWLVQSELSIDNQNKVSENHEFEAEKENDLNVVSMYDQ